MKKIILTIVQIAVTVALLIWVFHDPAQRAQMAKALRLADYRWVAAGVLAYVIVEIAAALRWDVLLRVQGIRLSALRLSGLFLIGIFYNQFLPGGTGGDIMKSYLLLKETPHHKAGALLAVVFDRLIGLFALVTITVTLVGFRYHWITQTPETKYLVGVLILLLSVSLASLFASFIISGFNLFHLLPHKFPGRDKLIEVAAAYHLYVHHWIATFFAFLISLIAHLATFSTFLCVAYAFHANVKVVDLFTVLPVERTITAVPISLAGIGLREQILQVMLHNLCGVEVAVAKLIGTMSFLVMLFSSMPGGIIYFFYKPSGVAKRVKLSEMEREVATAEHEIPEPQ